MTNPILQELINLSPAAKKAVQGAHDILRQHPDSGIANPATTQPALQQAQEAPPSLDGIAKSSPMLGNPLPDLGSSQNSQPGIIAPRGTVAGDNAELSRLRSTGSGVSQIHNPYLHGIARVGDVLGTIISPRVASAIPGTTLHHQQLGQQAQADVSNDIATQQGQAQIENLEQQPELARERMDLARENQQAVSDRASNAADSLREKNRIALRGRGYDYDADGNIVPVSHDSLSDKELGEISLNTAKMDAANAETALRRAQAEGVPEKIELARQNATLADRRLQEQQVGHSIARETLDLNREKFYNPQPSAAQRVRGDLAQSAVNQVNDMESIIKRRPDLFGKGRAAAQNFMQALGQGDPDALQYKTAATYLAEHGAGVFGSRAAYVIQKLEKVGTPDQDIPGILAELSQSKKTSQHFVDAGAIHGRPTPPLKVGDVVDGYRFKGGDKSKASNWEQVNNGR